MNEDAIYPCGDPIRQGDRVWWDDGGAVGYIHEIVDPSKCLDNYGIEEASVIIRINDPVNCAADLQTFAVPLKRLEDLGVWKLDEDECVIVDSVIGRARDLTGYSEVDASCSVLSPLVSGDRKSWRVCFYRNGQVLDSCFVQVPGSGSGLP